MNVSSNIMVGQHCKIGTNFETLLDEGSFSKNITEYNIKEVEKIDQDELDKEIDQLYSDVEEIVDKDFETNIRVKSSIKISKKEILRN